MSTELPPVKDIENPEHTAAEQEKPNYAYPDASFEKCLILYERNIYESLACKESSPYVATMVFVSQLIIPLFIISGYSDEMKTFTNGNLRVSWSVSLCGTFLQLMLWSMILTDTRKSTDSFDVTGGFTNLPRPYMIKFGMLFGSAVNSMSGIAAYYLIAKADTVEDVALNALAMFFVNRLDEDFARSKTGPEIWYTLCCSDDSSGIGELQENDEETAKRRRKRYGPWVYNYHLDSNCWGCATACFAMLMEFVSLLLSMAIPLVYFIYSIPI